MTYAQDMARLTSAAATLTTTSPPAAWPLAAEQVQPVLAARDTVTSALRDLAAALLRAAPSTARAAATVDAVTTPVAGDGALRGLQQALAALEPAVGADRPNLTQALSAGGGGLTQAWLGAARAAATLEGQHTAAALPVRPMPWRSPATISPSQLASLRGRQLLEEALGPRSGLQVQHPAALKGPERSAALPARSPVSRVDCCRGRRAAVTASLRAIQVCSRPPAPKASPLPTTQGRTPAA